MGSGFALLLMGQGEEGGGSQAETEAQAPGAVLLLATPASRLIHFSFIASGREECFPPLLPAHGLSFSVL